MIAEKRLPVARLSNPRPIFGFVNDAARVVRVNFPARRRFTGEKYFDKRRRNQSRRNRHKQHGGEKRRTDNRQAQTDLRDDNAENRNGQSAFPNRQNRNKV